MEQAGHKVTAIAATEEPNCVRPPDMIGLYEAMRFPQPFDAVWCSHVLEHVPNVNDFLHKIMWDTKKNGVIAITVPPHKDEVVGGHLTTWNPGLLLYNLIRAGLDCFGADVGAYGYNVSVITHNVRRPKTELLHDAGDINRLSPYFPYPFKDGDDGWTNCPEWS